LECGGRLDRPGLRDGLRRLGEVREAATRVDVRPSAEGWGDLAHVLDLRAGLAVAEATLAGALERRETRGCHNRSDFPAIDPALRVNILATLDGPEGRVATSAQAVPPVPTELDRWLADAPPIDAAGRLLE